MFPIWPLTYELYIFDQLQAADGLQMQVNWGFGD